MSYNPTADAFRQIADGITSRAIETIEKLARAEAVRTKKAKGRKADFLAKGKSAKKAKKPQAATAAEEAARLRKQAIETRDRDLRAGWLAKAAELDRSA